MATMVRVVNSMNIPGTFEVYDIETGQWASTCVNLKDAEATAAHLNRECGELAFTWTLIQPEPLGVGDVVTIGRFRRACRVVDITSSPLIYRFQDLDGGSEFCLSHSALTEAELQSRNG